jgi:hypothetical protein
MEKFFQTAIEAIAKTVNFVFFIPPTGTVTVVR